MTTNIPEASIIPMTSTTQQAPTVTIASIISKGIQSDSAILARSPTIPVGSAIPEAIPIHSFTLVHSAIPA
jgi:hypothetical protein